MKKLSLKDQCNSLRAEIKATENNVRALRKDDEFTPLPLCSALGGSGLQNLGGHGAEVCDTNQKSARPLPQYDEMDENLTLVIRHLEDARMRLGKVIQASEGGESIYDR